MDNPLKLFVRALVILGLICGLVSSLLLPGAVHAQPATFPLEDNADPPAFLALDLVQSTDGVAWEPVSGDLDGGFSMALCPTTAYHYLDASSASTNNELIAGLSAGVHTITATAIDAGGLTGSDQITLTVTSPSGNLPPIVSAGPDQTIDLFDEAILDGTVTDDGLPDPPGAVTTTWQQMSGPGTVTFADEAAEDTTASFSAAGGYVLSLTADDGELVASDQVSVTVSPGSTIRVPEDQPTIQAGIDAAQDGDRVLVSRGIYYETLTLTGKTITLASKFHTTQDPNFIDQTIIDGGGSAVITVGESVGPETTISGFTIQNGDDGISASARLHIVHNHFVGNLDAIDYESGGGICRNNVFDDNRDDAVDLDGASEVVIENNTMRNCGDDGIEIRLHNYSGPTLNIIIRGNLISGSGEDGIQLIDYAGLSDRFFLIEHNVIEATAMAGVGLMDKGDTVEDFRGASIPEPIHLFNNTLIGNDHGLTGGDNLIALNNLFVDSINVGVKRVDGGSIAAYNLFWNNGRDYRTSNIDLGTTLFADPLLDAEHHLLPGSPAIDAGTAHFEWGGATVLDLPDSAYHGAAPDLGRFEQPLLPDNTPPVAAIASPVNGATFTEGEPISFSGSATDAEDGDVTASLSWSSSLDGPIGSGGTFTRYGKYGFALDVSSVPVDFWSYWDAKGVYEGAPDWKGTMWEIINGNAPMFYLKVEGTGASQTFSLLDGLMWGYYGTEAHLRVNGDYPVGDYRFEGMIADIFGGESAITVGMAFGRDYPEFLTLDLAQSTDTVGWQPVVGTLADGFGLHLDPASPYYYLDVDNVSTDHDLAAGTHAFTLDAGSVPGDFWPYWDARGVYEGAPDWQGYMWEIVNGNVPMFYLKVEGTGSAQTFSLLDGLMWGYYGTEAHLRVDGDYPVGVYTFDGTIEDGCTNQTAVPVRIEFTELPGFETLGLVQSTDEITWDPVSGDLDSGYTMTLCPVVDYHYLEAGNVSTNYELVAGTHGFALDVSSVPVDFWSYWDAKGVYEGAPDWQGYMWEIISGNVPMFYLKVEGTGASQKFSLLDGLMWGYYGTEDHLRVNGDYPVGDYTFEGTIADIFGGESAITVGMAFGRDYPEFLTLNLAQSTDMIDWQPMVGTLADGFGLHLDPATETYYLDVDNVSTDHDLAAGTHAFTLDTGSVPGDFWPYWDARGVYEGAPDWQGYMWEIVNGNVPMFYLKVEGTGAGQTFTLLDGLIWGYYGTEAHLRVDGDYPVGVYTFDGTIEDGCTNRTTVSMWIEFTELPGFETLDLVESTDEIAWSPVSGDLDSGYTMTLCPAMEYHYLEAGNVSTNYELVGSKYGFALDASSVPVDFWSYWDAKGVYEGAPDWQGYMWEIISGNVPMFYLKVEGTGSAQTFSLLDGLMWGYYGTEAHLRVNGDYPVGDYTFEGTIADIFGGESAITVGMAFGRDYPEFLTLDLAQSTDTIDWQPVIGNLGEGWTVPLDSAFLYYYLDVDNVSTDHDLAAGTHAFTLDAGSVPGEFWPYWDARGVYEGAPDWQGYMWEIINGNAPMFYLKLEGAGAGQTFTLLDGLMWGYYGTEAHLRVDGDYPVGVYTFDGTIEDGCTNRTAVPVQIRFTELPAFEMLDLVQSTDELTWNPVSGNLESGYTMTLCPAVEYHYLDVDGDTLSTNNELAERYHPFSLDPGSVPAGYYAYWDAKGVNSSATGWQGYLYSIVSGAAPMFYLRVTDTGPGLEYMLVDGFKRDYEGIDTYLRVNGDYPVGDYSFEGAIEDTYGGESSVTVAMEFGRDYPEFLTLDLMQSTDTIDWQPVSGNLDEGWAMPLGPAAQYYYLDVANVSTDHDLAVGYYPFALDASSVPAGFY